MFCFIFLFHYSEDLSIGLMRTLQVYERVYSYCKVKEKLYHTSPPRRSDVGKLNAPMKDSKFLNKYNCRIV